MSILKALPERLLLGPGPSNAHPSVLEAMSRPLIGHLDPDFIALLDRAKEGLRTAFGTRNAMTLPISTPAAGLVTPGPPSGPCRPGIFLPHPPSVLVRTARESAYADN